MNYLALMPVVDEETTDKCMTTLSNKVRERLLVIDNSADGFAGKYNVDAEWHPENLGVGRSWNIGARRVLDEGLDYLVIISATMLFRAGMDDFVRHLEVNGDPHGLETQHAWHCIALGRPTFETIGLFDENFYPGYYEDSDFIRRMELAGIHNPMSSIDRLPRIIINASYQGDAHGGRSGIKINMGACHNYFVTKWGHEPRYDSQRDRDILYRWPFNDPGNGLDFWEPRSVEELKDIYHLNPEEEETRTDEPVTDTDPE